MQADVKGSTLPVLEVQLAPGETVVTPHGELSWMSANVQMTQTVGGQQGGGGGGFMGAMKRVLGGGGLFLTQYQAQGGPALVAFAAKVPGHIVPVDIMPGRSFMVHRHGWLCGTPGITPSVGLQQSFRGGLWGGDGFVLQKLEGQGRAWIELSGELTTYTLGPGQTMLVHPGHVGMFEQSVSFTITRIPGIANKIFGGDGYHLVALTGPGQIWLQSMTLPGLAHALAPYLPTNEAAPAAAGGIVGSMLRG
ncbi:AIM24 family protein [Streptacidiphilus fuscans]|uniref:AIM24 family protein n=1 Tax=Streptacidiphilus fuscans TaxID=2789292 RepID=A0A931BBM8_9ACTN|nr:AIM24 family protein [Streptacidiphilus fuscans]MBF9070455.1 AIM24 family protein [Streptacidiphilus fuscans]